MDGAHPNTTQTQLDADDIIVIVPTMAIAKADFARLR
jgi:hypothetical protein